MLDVVILRIDPELKREDFNSLLSLVPYEKQARIMKFHLFRDARNCLLGDILARAEICRTTGLHNEQLEFSTNEFGKPFLLTDPDIHFNISHSGDYIACALSDESVGIDVEIFKPTDLKIAKRFFTSDETTYIQNGEEMLRFYEVWTKKESKIKWEGKGLHIPLSSFSVFESDKSSQLHYYTAFHNNEAICYICSEKFTLPNTHILDTSTFLQHTTKLFLM